MSFYFTLALGDFLNIRALLLNILAWKLDFNFLRIFLFSECSNFPKAYSYFMKAISSRPSLQITFGVFQLKLLLLDESTRASIKTQHRLGSLNGSNLFFSQLFLMNILISPSFHSGSPLLPVYFIFFLILRSPPNKTGDGGTPVCLHFILIRKTGLLVSCSHNR